MIKNSLEWSNLNRSLRLQACKKISDGKNLRQVIRLLNNLDYDIARLSKAEIQIRHGNSRDAEEILQIVNQNIRMVEEYILVAALIG